MPDSQPASQPIWPLSLLQRPAAAEDDQPNMTTTNDDGTAPVPEPAGLPLLGNLGAIDPEFPLGSLMSMADKHGEILRMRFPGRTMVIVSTRALVNEVCDEKRFQKSINPTLREVRHGVHDGLFSARAEEENWGIAHRVLMPAFGPLSIRGMFDEMHDIASQLALKWARYGPNHQIMVTDDFTRLTLDTLALCSMGFRFNSFYSPEMHPFIEAMGDFLVECGNRGRRAPLPSLFYRSQDQKFDSDIEVLRTTAREVLESRKGGEGGERKDLLHAMMQGVDTKTGKKMTDESIMDNLITFLIAGHETTSGLLSFAFYQLMKHPACYEKAQREVDELVGKGPITVDHLSKMPYINAVLRETLRINATIPVISVGALEETTLGGKYKVAKDEVVLLLLAKSHLDPLVWGSDAPEFKPERMLDANFERTTKEFPNAWKPFGNGIRGCIGRPFAWQEALLVMAMLLQNFNFVPEAGYKFAYKQTLTVKPKDFHMRAVLRDGLTPTTLERRLQGLSPASETAKVVSTGSSAGAGAGAGATGAPMTILYGSNSGTCEALARRVAADAPSHGFRAVTVDCMDSAKDRLPTDQPVVIITASYEGQPPDNAGHFVAWLEAADQAGQPLKKVSYAVFGCGHKDWAQTFHRIPNLVDTTLEQLGASRLAVAGLTDASTGAVFSDFETWEDDKLWPALAARYNVKKSDAGAKEDGSDRIKVHVSNPRTSTLRQDVQEARVVEAKALTAASGPEDGGKHVKRHLEIELPEGMSYAAGDYLAVLPINPAETVQRALRRFRLARDAHVTIESPDSQTALPVNTSVPVFEVLSSYVELSQPATKRNLLALQDAAADDATKQELGRLAGDAYADEIGVKRVSVLDILDRFPSVELPIGSFLAMMPPMRVRQYSISSSPLWNPSHVTLTFSVLDAPSLSGQGRHVGVATSYLASLGVGDSVHVAVRPSHVAFGLPSDPERTPLLCVAAGTGLAPFRGFVQERAAMISAGRQGLAPALLYYGCRDAAVDDLYRDEFDKWEALGAVEVRRAFSRAAAGDGGPKHVQDVILEDADRLSELWKAGAKVMVCGSRGVSQNVMDAMVRIRVDKGKEMGKEFSEDEARQYFDDLRNVRYATDVFD